ncbi:TIGR01906 family membrane protein [Inediibacterium massiliense]|uniref:TIGR01906 family membrane protein n=1 Tax=Inediibacterium massiliense TaxID=1658111 RepID=UPI0006B4F0B4|nr:TIGR01906 family membrane protein [Inediibacterium massiliense]
MKKKFMMMSKVIIIVFVPVVILLCSLKEYALNENFYMNEFKKYHIGQNTNIDDESLHEIAKGIVDYLKDDQKDLIIFVEKNGKRIEAFNHKEKLHMKDVKVLFQRGYFLKNLGFCFIGFAFFVMIGCSGIWKKVLGKSLMKSSVLSFVFVFCLYVLMKINFYRYFTYFHKIFFNNDLWLLNPKTDLLIQILPLEFFIDIAQRTLILFLGIMFLVGIIGFVVFKHFVKR